MTLIHATSVAIEDHALLIMGASGMGKSDLALQLIDRGATLICDDQTMLSKDGDRLLVSPPESIAGKLEVRGIGIVPFPYTQKIPLRLVIRLVDRQEEPRLPDPQAIDMQGVSLPCLHLGAHGASLAIKVGLVMQHLCGQDDSSGKRGLGDKGIWGV